MTTIEIQNLHKRFGDVQALDGMSFTVHDGEMYGFVGSNGAGKSTTMRIALGVLAADSGEVLLDRRPLDDDTRRRIGYMVLAFLFAVMLPLAYFLKKEYWKDVH